VYSGRKVRVQATIAGFGTERAARRVALVLNGREIDSKAVDVPPNGRASAEFLSLDAPFGMNRGEVRIDAADTLPDDDRYYFSLERAEARKALFVREPSGTRSILYFRAALEAGGDAAFSLEDVTVDQAAGRNPANYAFIVLSDVGPLPPGFEKALGDYVRRGGALLVALGRSSLGNARVPVADRSISSTRYSPSEGERFQTAVWLDSGHPSIGPASQWQDIRFFQAVKVEPGRARVAVRLSDETPLLLDETVGEGRVLVFASTFDNVANDFPLHGAFVPFIEKTAAYLARLDEGAGAFLVGSHYDLRATRGRGESIEVLDPKGARALSLEESTRAETLRLANTGYYDVRRPSGRHDLVAVNADRKESDLDVIPAETLALWRNTARPGESGGAADGEPERKPSPLWWYVLIAALAVAVAESLLGNKHLGVESGEKEAAA
jgi:hypothetical protein